MHKLDPQVAQYLETVRSRPPAYLLSIEKLREELDKLRDHYPPEPVEKIDDIDIPGPAGKIPHIDPYVRFGPCGACTRAASLRQDSHRRTWGIETGNCRSIRNRDAGRGRPNDDKGIGRNHEL